MGNQDPPQVRRAPGRFHVVVPVWTVPMRVGDQQVAASGSLVWDPGPSPMPWIVVAIVSLAIASLAGLTTRWKVGIGVLAIVIVAIDVAHALGVAFSAAGSADKVKVLVGGSLYSFVAWVAGIAAAVMLARDRGDGLFAAGFAGLLVAIAGGLVDIGDLSHSQVPYAWGANVARALVALSLGLGVGVALASAIALRRNPPPPADATTG